MSIFLVDFSYGNPAPDCVQMGQQSWLAGLPMELHSHIVFIHWEHFVERKEKKKKPVSLLKWNSDTISTSSKSPVSFNWWNKFISISNFFMMSWDYFNSSCGKNLVIMTSVSQSIAIKLHQSEMQIPGPHRASESVYVGAEPVIYQRLP